MKSGKTVGNILIMVGSRGKEERLLHIHLFDAIESNHSFRSENKGVPTIFKRIDLYCTTALV